VMLKAYNWIHKRVSSGALQIREAMDLPWDIDRSSRHADTLLS